MGLTPAARTRVGEGVFLLLKVGDELGDGVLSYSLNGLLVTIFAGRSCTVVVGAFGAVLDCSQVRASVDLRPSIVRPSRARGLVAGVVVSGGWPSSRSLAAQKERTLGEALMRAFDSRSEVSKRRSSATDDWLRKRRSRIWWSRERREDRWATPRQAKVVQRTEDV